MTLGLEVIAMLRLLAVVLSVIVLLGCQAEDREAKTAPPLTKPSISASPPRADLSTPERALKSYWARKDWYMDEGRKAYEKADLGLPKGGDVYAAVTTGQALAYWTSFPPYTQPKLQRDIDTVKQETDSRAVVLVRIKNVSPIPEGVQASSRDVKRREAGVMFRYVLEKEGSAWKVAEVWRNDDIAGWKKMLEEIAPSYPSDVYDD